MVTAVCTAGFLGMQEQVLILPIKGWVPLFWFLVLPPPFFLPSFMPKENVL